MKFWRKKNQAPKPRSAVASRILENFTPPEGVTVGLELASLGARFGAVLLDLLVTWFAIGAVVLLLAYLQVLPSSALISLFLILAFFAGVPYYILAELIWNGRTLGKRIVGIRVVSLDGRALSPHQIVTRNLLKEVEFFTPFGLLFQLKTLAYSITAVVVFWLILVAVYFWRGKRKQRIGDAVAGTIVIVKPKATLLQDLALNRPISRFVFDQAQLDIYGRYELQTLETILRISNKSEAHQAEQIKVARAIAKRISYAERLDAVDVRDFLMAFYNEQRERLESRQLFGERRDDKFHSSSAQSAD